MANPDGSQDSNAVSVYETSTGLSVVFGTIDGSSGTAGLKVTSKCRDFHATAEKIVGGSENCVDLNNECAEVVVESQCYVVKGKYALSAKTCAGVTFRGLIYGVPSKWHVNLGSWSDQSKKPQTRTRLELTATAYPIVVWVGNADLPELDDPRKYKVIGFGKYGKVVRAVCMFFWDVGKRLNLN